MFHPSTLRTYMTEVTSLLFQTPAYQELNKLYEGGQSNSFNSPDVDYYRLQFLKRYRFSTFDGQNNCECFTCEVRFLDFYNHEIET